MNSTPYIATRRARIITIGGHPVNIPWGTVMEETDGVLFRDGLPVCTITSDNAHAFFARNDDGHGLERGHLTAAIMAKLAKRDRNHQSRWDRVRADRLCRKYRQRKHADFWLWSHEFFGAPIDDLQHIAEVVGLPVEVRP